MGGTFSVADFMDKLNNEAMPTSQPLNQFEAFQGRVPEGGSASAAPSGAKAVPQAKATGHGNAPSGAKAGKTQDPVEAFLEQHPYVKGFQPTKADREHYESLLSSGLPTTPNLQRWFAHVESFTETERKKWN